MILLLVLSTFIFHSSQRPVDGYLEMPSAPPRALLLYFHRYTEKGEAVETWEGITSRGYAVAGYTNFPVSHVVPMANDAVSTLRQNGMQGIPVIAMGASMGAIYAAQWFAANPQVRALILIVPGSEDICDSLSHSGGRPVFLIQAENDDTTFGSGAKIRKCLPNGKQYLVKGASHNFPPDAIIGEIADWLDSLPLMERQ
jgi:pimeloyl-ACP methyl ester carboxylesterase